MEQEREYTIAAVEDIETCLALLRKIRFCRESVGLNGRQLRELEHNLLTLSRLENELGEMYL